MTVRSFGRKNDTYTIVAVLLLLLNATFLRAQGTMTTVAGNGQFQFTGNGGPATSAPLGAIAGVATDPSGNVFAVDGNNHLVVKISGTGVLTIVAGNGTVGHSGDGGPATSASFIGPVAVAADGNGNVFVLDGGFAPEIPAGVCVVRKVGGDGTISTFAGSAGCGFGGDGGPATQAFINRPQGISVDSIGNLYIADTGNNRIRKVTPQGIISTVAGNGQCCYTGDGVQATSTAINDPYGVAVDQNGVLYIADTFNDRVRRVGTDGLITTIAGGNGRGYSGDGGPATASMLNWPAGVALDGGGNIYIADMFNHRARKITPDGIIRTIAGTGTTNFTGDQGPSSLATLNTPTGIAVDIAGNIYIADSQNFRVRRIDASGTITTYAGNGDYGFGGDGGQARAAVLNHPFSVLADVSGNVYISDTGNNRVREIAPNGVITTVAGGSAGGFDGDGGPATRALLKSPAGLALDGDGNLYIADSGNARVRKIDRNGTISTFAGNGASPANGIGDGGPARDASFNYVGDVAFDAAGNLYIADALAGRIRKVSQGGTITTIATGLLFPTGVAVDAAGNVYASVGALQVSTRGGGVVRISPGGATTFLTGNFLRPGKIAIDARGNLYVPESTTIPGPTVSQVIQVPPGGAQSIFAGSGEVGFFGDEGPAPLAQLSSPTGVALDSAGNLYIADNGNNRIRKVSVNPRFVEPQGTVFLSTTPGADCPGFYIAEVNLRPGFTGGFWGLEILLTAGDRLLQGGINLGGEFAANGGNPGFAAFNITNPADEPQNVNINLNAQVLATGGFDAANFGMSVQIFQQVGTARTAVGAPIVGLPPFSVLRTLGPGFYVVGIQSLAGSPAGTYQLSLTTSFTNRIGGGFKGGVDLGGMLIPDDSGNTAPGFGAFCISQAQNVSLRSLAAPSYPGAGAGGLTLRVLDQNRGVVWDADTSPSAP